MWHRLKPAFALLLLAPLIAEYLLGSLSFGQLGLFPLMVPMYGGGALLVRELARRYGRGWPTIFALGLAYAVIEEGLATQSLFNPHYLGLHLLRYGFIPALGIAGPWTVYVVVLHMAWSIAVPIGLVEMLFPRQRHAPWLGRAGLGVTAVMYVLGAGLIALGTWKKEQFAASETQLLVAAAVALAAAAGAFAFFRRHVAEEASTPSATWPPWVLGVVAFGAGSLFHLLSQLGGAVFPAALNVTGLLLLPAAVMLAVRTACKSGGRSVAGTDALVLGGVLVYGWLGFFMAARLHGAGAIPGQFFPCLIVLALVFVRWVRRRQPG
jgi:hypothetical protein